MTLLVVPIAAADLQQDVTLYVEVHDRLLSVRAVNVPLEDVLREVGKKAGFRLTADGHSRLEEVRVYSEPPDIREAEKTKSKFLANAPLHVVQLLPPGEAEWPSTKVLGSVPVTAAKMPVFRVPKASRIPQERSH